MGYFRRICNELPKAVAIESNMYLEVSFICMLGIYIISRLTNNRAHTLRCSWQTKGGRGSSREWVHRGNDGKIFCETSHF